MTKIERVTSNNTVSLYRKNGYQIIPNYAPYIGEESSICFEKKL